jgi:hypothetical protein
VDVLRRQVTKIKAEVDTLHAASAVYGRAVSVHIGGLRDCFLPTSPHTRSPSPTSPTSSRSVITGFRVKEAAKRGDMDRVARLAVAIPRLARQGDPDGVLEVMSDRGSSRLLSMADKAAARAESGAEKGEKLDDKFKRSGRQLTPTGFDLQFDMQPDSATPSESLPPPPMRDRGCLQSALENVQTEQDRSSPPPLQAKIPPDMLERAELWARLERLDLLHRLASAHTEEDSAVSTRSSSLRPPARDHERFDDRHAPPSEHHRAWWASTGDAGVTVHQQREGHMPAPPASQSLFSPKEITQATDCSGPHDAPPLECSLESELSSASTPLPIEAQSVTDNTKLDAAEYSSEEPATPSIRQCHARTDSGLSECKMPVASRAKSSAMEKLPDHEEMCGELTLKGTMDHRRSMRAKCYLDRCMLTLIIPKQASRDSSGGGIQRNLAVHILVEALAVRLPQVRTDAFEIGTLHENKMNNEICCVTDNQAEREEWIATFRRMGVAIFD